MFKKKRVPSCSCNPPPEKYEPEEKECPKCGVPLRVKKTQKRRLVTPDKDTKVVEVIKTCNCSRETFVSKKLRKRTPKKSPYSFDILANIGRLRFEEHRQVSDIRRHFYKSGISIPDTTAQRLCKRFLKYFTAVHRESLPQIKEKIEQNGGYVLQIDGTQNHGRGTIMLLKDSISGIRLFSARVVSEKADYIEPILKDIRDLYGHPLAVIRDMGKGIAKAVESIFEGTVVIICHFHFLRALGDRLFKYYHDKFRKNVDKTGVKGKLEELRRNAKTRLKTARDSFAVEILNELVGILDDVLTSSGEGLGYPFDLSKLRFYERCLKAEKRVGKLVERCIKAWNRVAIAYDVHEVLKRLHKSSYLLAKYAEILQEREIWFTKARQALRWKNGPIPLSTKVRWSDRELKAARKGIDTFLEEICSNQKVELAFKGKRSHLLRAFGTIEQMFTENLERLLAPNVEVQTPKGKRVIKLERTNNGVEQDFRSIRRHGRRLKGNTDVEELIQKEGVGLLLLLNMEIEEYVKTVYGSWDMMGKKFAEAKNGSLVVAEKIFDGSNR
jgi:hypothetical protein